jgi:hypothetical protein
VVERLPVSSAGKTDHQAIQALFETPEPGTRDPGA